MIAELGHYTLILALSLALVQSVIPMIGAQIGNSAMMRVATPASLAQFLALGISFGALTYSYVTSDFSVLNVVSNSHSLKPMLYKISGVWGNHEGSLLLWVTVLALFGLLVAVFGGNISPGLKARTLAVQAMVTVGFLLFMILTSNPFERIFPAPIEGQDLNPLLQDPGLAFHPPMLYVGYVGLSIAFSFAVAALIEGKVDAAWARWVRPWTLLAWAFLTAGIALGSWWAYYELGWGGFWYWDPVENASFMPWLAATALLHSAIVVEKRDTLKSWTILLAIIAFSFSLIGTFLVRSGVLTSVHAFATDPERGVFILLLLVVAIGGSLSLFVYRAMDLKPGGLFQPISREGALLLNNLLLATGLATVFIGTLYPLFLETLTDEKVSVGPPFYNATFVPLMIPLLIALGVGPFLSWKRADLRAALLRLRFAFFITVIISIIAGILVWGQSAYSLVFLSISAWLAVSVLFEMGKRVGLPQASLGTAWRRLWRLPGSAWGMSFAHFGVALVVAGSTGASLLTNEIITVMKPGDRLEISGFELQFEGTRDAFGSNYRGTAGEFTAFLDGEAIATMRPESRQYVTRSMGTTEAALYTTTWYDLYVVIGDPSGDGYVVNAYFKPLVPWLWIGSTMMVLGGFFSLADRRLRVGAPKRSTDKSTGGDQKPSGPGKLVDA